MVRGAPLNCDVNLWTATQTFSPTAGTPTTITSPGTGISTAVIAYLQGTNANGAYMQFNDESASVTRAYFGYGPNLFTGADAADAGFAVRVRQYALQRE